MKDISITYKKSDNLTMFNPSFIDDYGFTPEEFRIFARIMRRCAGEKHDFYESIPSLVRELHISAALVRRALAVLERCNAVTREVRPGLSDLFQFNTCNKWKSPDKLPSIRAEIYGKNMAVDRLRKRVEPLPFPRGVGNGTPTVSNKGTPTVSDTTPLSETIYEGISPEGTPLKEEEGLRICSATDAREAGEKTREESTNVLTIFLDENGRELLSEFPFKPLFDKFPHLQLSIRQIEQIRNAVEAADTDAWQKTINQYAGNYDAARPQSWNPQRVGTLLNVFEGHKQTKGRTNGNNQKPTYREQRANEARRSFERESTIRERVRKRTAELSRPALPNRAR